MQQKPGENYWFIHTTTRQRIDVPGARTVAEAKRVARRLCMSTWRDGLIITSPWGDAYLIERVSTIEGEGSHFSILDLSGGPDDCKEVGRFNAKRFEVVLAGKVDGRYDDEAGALAIARAAVTRWKFTAKVRDCGAEVVRLRWDKQSECVIEERV